MTSAQYELDLTPHPRRDIAEKVLGVATALFESVKNAPLPLRASFPSILRNNNFALTVRVTKRFVFLEVMSKSRAQRTREAERLAAYRQFFTPTESGRVSLFRVDNARLCRFSGATFEGASAFSLGHDISLCVSEARNVQKVGDKTHTANIDLIYVVGFGEQLHEDNSWQEIDALIRVTLADWSALKWAPFCRIALMRSEYW
jgi:hypothetical protein